MISDLDSDGGPSAAAGRRPERPQDRPAPGLHVVAGPIGNRGDITARALTVLRHSDVVACEDTRATGALLEHYGLHVPLISYHDHNAEQRRPQLLERIAGGAVVTLMSDAGTPLVADPGYKLVRAVIDAGHPLQALPGPSAVLAALVLSGLPSDRFTFLGFPPARKGARRHWLAALAARPETLILYESPRRLAALLADMAATLGDRPAAVAREMTKYHEEVIRDSVPALARRYGAAAAPRGEIVVVVGGVAASGTGDDGDESPALDAVLRLALAGGGVRAVSDAVAALTRRPRRQVYQRALALSAHDDAAGDDAAGNDAPDDDAAGDRSAGDGSARDPSGEDDAS